MSKFPLLAACLAAVTSVQAAQVTREEIPLWPGVAPGSENYDGEEVWDSRTVNNAWVKNTSNPTLTVYFPEEGLRVGTGVVICAGGGYAGLAIGKEGHALAEWFAYRGVVAGVLKYRCGGGPHQHPIPLNDAQRAMRMMRENASQWELKNDRIGIAGFSAGGHLATTAGTRTAMGDPNAEDPIERVSSRADFMVLAYPAVSMRDGVTHAGSKKNLLGENPDDSLVRELSNDMHVNADTAPTFLIHAANDDGVPVENSLLFFQALRKHNVPAELHIYETGGHGFGFHRGTRPVDAWPELLEGWLRGRGLIE